MIDDRKSEDHRRSARMTCRESRRLMGETRRVINESRRIIEETRRLEQDSKRLNQKEDSQTWSFVIQDAGWGWGQHQMARPYSQDLRDRVMGWVASGRTCRATAALFGVSVASVVKWSQRWRMSGSAAAKPMDGCKQLRLNSEREWLLARIAEKPDLTCAQW